MIRATLDVNVLVSGFPASGGAPAELIARWLRRDFDLVLSEHILAGLVRAWNRPYWRARYRSGEAQRTIVLLRDRAVLVEPAGTVRGVGQDEEDDLVLATAVAGNADFLVTGDKPLQAVGSYQSVIIFSPRQFLTLLDRRTTGP